MTIGERVKELRKALRLTQTEFGERLGVARITVAYYESGKNNLNEYMIQNICKTFNVDYNWLTQGKFEMFLEKDTTLIKKLLSEYNIDPSQIPLINAYLKSSSETKEELLKFALSVQKEGENNE